MDNQISQSFAEVLNCVRAIGGEVAMLNENCIIVSWNHLTGIIFFHASGEISLKVSTPWKDEDVANVNHRDEITDTLLDLLTNFWTRRGIRTYDGQT